MGSPFSQHWVQRVKVKKGKKFPLSSSASPSQVVWLTAPFPRRVAVAATSGERPDSLPQTRVRARAGCRETEGCPGLPQARGPRTSLRLARMPSGDGALEREREPHVFPEAGEVRGAGGGPADRGNSRRSTRRGRSQLGAFIFLPWQPCSCRVLRESGRAGHIP